ncbi:hypothetical protein [Pediococcus acidilactici]|uniref:hypothetical protein n=1 Tax=Pediococcus acidilactici TaxID=1254 RepID=UPI003857CBC3
MLIDELIPGGNLALFTALVGVLVFLLKNKFYSLINPIIVNKNSVCIFLYVVLVFGLIILIIIYTLSLIEVVRTIRIDLKVYNLDIIRHCWIYIFALIFILGIITFVWGLVLIITETKSILTYEFREFPTANIELVKDKEKVFLIKELSSGDFLAVRNNTELKDKQFFFIEKKALETGTKITYEKFKSLN